MIEYNVPQRNLTVRLILRQMMDSICIYMTKVQCYSQSEPLLLKIPLMMVGATSASGEGWNSDLLTGVGVANSNGLIFVGKVSDNAFSKDIEGSA